MSIFLTADGAFHRDDAASTLECPHCNTVAHMTLVAAPDFATLQAHRPAETGIVLRCDACAAPVFLRYRINTWQPERIEFHPWAQEVERPREQFAFTYLPAAVAAPFREALGCYTHGLLGAFAAMCRLTAQAMFRDLGEAGRLRLFDQLDEVRELSGVDDRSFEIARRIIFDAGTTSLPPAPGRADAAVLLEAMKDLLYQNYVRGGRLRKALRMRRFFAGEQELETSGETDQD
ncbi:MAG: hypothetical protein QNJ73_17400 [Gammaproteobacteria bacterium]|nr:hypothetical protein [Gammaproteobacteria bacterium]